MRQIYAFLLVLVPFLIASPASAECYINAFNDYICDDYKGAPARGNFKRDLKDIDTDTKVPLPPIAKYPPSFFPPNACTSTPAATGPIAASCPNGATVNVRNQSEFQSKMNALSCGDKLYLAAGSYSGNYTLNQNCGSNQIVISGACDDGAKFNGKLTLRGSGVVISGLRTSSGSLVIDGGNNNQITRNYISGGGGIGVLLISGANNNTVSYNDISGLNNYGIQIKLSKGDGKVAANNSFIGNYIHDFASGRKNGAEAIQVGPGPATTHYKTNTLIQGNLIERVSIDSELISLKSSGNKVIGNTFLNSQAYVSLRHGENNLVEGNYIDVQHGLRVHGHNHKIIGNTVKGTIYIMGGDITQQQKENGDNGHPFASSTLVKNNTANQINVGYAYGNPKYPAQNTTVTGNKGQVVFTNRASGSSTPGNGANVSPLSKSDVGPEAGNGGKSDVDAPPAAATNDTDCVPDDGGTIPVAGPVDVSAPPKECEGEWKRVASDQLGWFSKSRAANPNNREVRLALPRFSIEPMPDGSKAVQDQQRKGQEIHSPEVNSPILYAPGKDGPMYCAVMLRYKYMNEKNKWRTPGGKYISLMAGRGQAGGYYLNRHSYPEGWSQYTRPHPTKGVSNAHKPGATVLLDAAIGSANRSQTGAKCVSSSRNSDGGDPVGGNKRRCFEDGYGKSPVEPTGQWITVEIVSVMNDKGKANGAAYTTFNGKSIGRVNNVMWAKDPERSAPVFIEWRNMNGGNPEDTHMRPPYDMKQWFQDFELLIIEK